MGKHAGSNYVRCANSVAISGVSLMGRRSERLGRLSGSASDGRAGDNDVIQVVSRAFDV